MTKCEPKTLREAFARQAIQTFKGHPCAQTFEAAARAVVRDTGCSLKYAREFIARKYQGRTFL